jgi:hypothetical protein
MIKLSGPFSGENSVEKMMGLLVNGDWQEDISRTKEGRFIRPAAAFRNFVTPDGSAGPSGEGGFAAEAGRYHLYISLACPWAHRTLMGIRYRARRHARQRERQGDAGGDLSAR